MDYQALFAAIKEQLITRKKYSLRQIGEVVSVSDATVHDWLMKKDCKPKPFRRPESFVKLIELSKVNLDDFADHNSLGGRVELLRWKNKLSVAELAEKIGRNAGTVSSIERGARENLTNPIIKKMAEALNTTTDYLLNGNPKEPKNGLVDFPKPTVQIEMEEVKAVEPETPVIENNEQIPLVPIILSKIGDQEVNSVSARDLYLDLGMDKSIWARWSKTNIVENQFFNEGIDFISLCTKPSEKAHGKFATDYAVTIEFAKHIAMMAKTKRAHDYRNYFIEYEKAAKGEIQKFERGAEQIVISNLRENLNEAVEIMTILGLSPKQAATSALNIVKNSTGVDILALAGNPEI